MHGELTLSASTLIGFLLVLGRMLGAFIFVPLPGKDSGPTAARILIAFACTLALFPRWPNINSGEITLGVMATWLVSEAALGMAIGLMVSFVAEALTLGAQVLSVQAGYGYASVVDPSTQADSEVLAVLAQLTAGLLFVTSGLDKYVITAFAASLDSYPPGTFVVTRDIAKAVVQVGADVFSVGLRLAFPVVGLLLMTEIALALLGRINSQLQLGHHAFPMKMLITLLTLAAVLAVAPSLYMGFAMKVLRVTAHIFAK